MSDHPAYTYGSFTLPGEAGYEDLTLRLAKRWGADTIRDSDGTQLSPEIANSGYDIYSTLCLVRADNAWAKANPTKLQQCFLMSFPVMADGSSVTIEPLKGYFREQMKLNLDDSPAEWWQVHDRTAGVEVAPENWSVSPEGIVTIKNTTPWHRYTVNFLAYRIWEEISMYNHVTNNWGNREHLMPVDPIFPEVREHLLKMLEKWIAEHPQTKVVRFTSMFYNFFWPWSEDQKVRRFVLNDWGSYEFSVSPEAIRQFEKVKGYRPRSEDFVNAGLYCSSHTVPSPVYRDWIEFMMGFVADYSRECVQMVKAAGKKAYVFYNDHWIGLEPTMPRFASIGFDGIIDGIFSGFESRKVSGCTGVQVRELRLHPYFFPTGVNGAPSFLPGGDPTTECKTYWLDIRRALLREPCHRIGFGGYLHLVENHPAFIDYVEGLTQEFRRLKELHEGDAVYTQPVKVAILSAWGNLRAWACCGHYNHGNLYNEVMETLSGLPVETIFISFDDLLDKGIPADVDVIVNAGARDDSWNGGVRWTDAKVIEILSGWVANGGGFIGVGEPSATWHGGHLFQAAHLLGVDRELGFSINHTKYPFKVSSDAHFITADLPAGEKLAYDVDRVYAHDGSTTVLRAEGKNVRIATRETGKGRSVYLSGHKFTPEQARLLHRAVLWAAQKEGVFAPWSSSNPAVEVAYYPTHQTLVVANLTAEAQETDVTLGDGESTHAFAVPAYGCVITKL